jgi:hypothetical protein
MLLKQGTMTTVSSLKSSGLASNKVSSSASLGPDANAQVSAVTTSTPTAGLSEVPTPTEALAPSSQGEITFKTCKWSVMI